MFAFKSVLDELRCFKKVTDVKLNFVLSAQKFLSILGSSENVL